MLSPKERTIASPPKLQSLELEARAKVNLRLKIERIRESDGYHLMNMLNVSTSFHDSLMITYSLDGESKVDIATSEIALSDDEKTTICSLEKGYIGKAIGAFLKVFKVPGSVHVSLTKRIPLKAGLGGGTTDAACVLRWLYLQVEEDRIQSGLAKQKREAALLNIAATVGADVPFSVYVKPAWVRGIGEEITPLTSNPLSGVACVLVCPNQSVSTPEILKVTRARWLQSGETIDKVGRMFENDISYNSVLGLVENDYANPVFEKFPEIKKVYDILSKIDDGVVGMSGAGSTLFVLPRNEKESVIELSERVQKLVKGSPATVYQTSIV